MKKRIYIIIGLVVAAIVFLALLISQKTKGSPLNVISTVPKNNEVFVNEKSEILITLNRSLAADESNALKVEVTPEEKTETVYQGNRTRISPETSFRLNTDYEVKVIFKNKEIYKFSFETTPFTPEQIQEEGAKQTEGDLVFSDAYKKFLGKYPWYSRLPVDKFEYRIIYDFETESFRIRFRIPVQNEEQKGVIVKKALEDLKKIGVKDPINYYTIDFQP